MSAAERATHLDTLREPGSDAGQAEPTAARSVADIENVMHEAAGAWACLIGPQAAGKTTYAQYLQVCNAGFEKHEWSLHPLIEEVTDGLAIERIEAAPSIPLLNVETMPIDRGRKQFQAVRGTKDILHFQAITGRGDRATVGDVHGQLPVHFFDLPGEWPRQTDLKGARRKDWQRAPMERLLRKTELFVLFVPFWALLPRQWLARSARAAAGESIWGTSLAVADENDQLDEKKLADAAAGAHEDVKLWVDAILRHRTEPFDLLIVLSQFQQSPVEDLLNGYSAGLGSGIFHAYQQLLENPDAGGDALGALTGKLSLLRETGIDLLRAIDDETRRRDDGESQVLGALDSLVEFRRRASGVG